MSENYQPSRQWESINPEAGGMDSGKLDSLTRIIQTQHRNINGVVIVKNGKLVFERYFNGYEAEDTSNVASVTKSFTSALIGIALAKDYIESIDCKVLDFFPEYKPAPGDYIKKTITIKHLLTMTAPTSLKSAASGNEALDRLRRQPDWCRFILDQLGKTRKPEKFYYSTSNTHLLSAIISRTTGACAREFANIHLFRPMGMKEISDHEMGAFAIDDVFGKNVSGWIRDPQGITAGGMGLTITPRDMARFGLLYLNRGRWGREQIIPEDWIDSSVSPDSGEYGYLWWLLNMNNLKVYAALGSGGNGIWCIPEKNLVVAVTADFVRHPPDFLNEIEKYIL